MYIDKFVNLYLKGNYINSVRMVKDMCNYLKSKFWHRNWVIPNNSHELMIHFIFSYLSIRSISNIFEDDDRKLNLHEKLICKNLWSTDVCHLLHHSKYDAPIIRRKERHLEIKLNNKMSRKAQIMSQSYWVKWKTVLCAASMLIPR